MQREPLSRGCRHRPAWNKLWTLFHPEFKAVKSDMRIKSTSPLVLLVLPLGFAQAQGTVPTFRVTAGQGSYTLAGRDPASGGSTTIPTVLVPVTLSFDVEEERCGKPFIMDAARGCTARSPLACLLQVRLPLGRHDAVCRRHAAHHLSQGRRVAYAARQAGSEARKDRGAPRLRLHPHLEEDRRLLRRRGSRVSAEGALPADSQTGRQAGHRRDA